MNKTNNLELQPSNANFNSNYGNSNMNKALHFRTGIEGPARS